MDWSRLASAASRFLRNSPQKSSSHDKFKEVEILLKKRFPPALPPGAPAPPTLEPALGLKGVVVVLLPVVGGTPAIGVAPVVTGVKAVDGARVLPKAEPAPVAAPFALAMLWMYCNA